MYQRHFRRCFSFALPCAALLFFSVRSIEASNIVTIDFDNMTAGDKESTFLDAYGIPLVTYGGTGTGALGPRVFDPVNFFPPSEPHVLVQWSSENEYGETNWLNFFFDEGLVEFSLTRMGTHSGSSHNTWWAAFYDEYDEPIGSFGETGLFINAPEETFTFTAEPGDHITRMMLNSIWTNATFGAILVDDFVLTFDGVQDTVPEPSTLALLLLGVVGLAGNSFRRRKTA